MLRQKSLCRHTSCRARLWTEENSRVTVDPLQGDAEVSIAGSVLCTVGRTLHLFFVSVVLICNVSTPRKSLCLLKRINTWEFNWNDPNDSVGKHV